MAILSFDPAGVRKLCEHALSTKDHSPLFHQQGEKVEPGLWLVGDRGVYLMSNGIPRQMSDGTLASDPDQQGESFIVYAEGISPDDEGWYETKRRVFGGDDGADHLSAAEVLGILDALPEGKAFCVDLTETSMRIGI